MSEPVELGFRKRVAAAFATDLGSKVYELVVPPDVKPPFAVYRRVSPGDTQYRVKTARLQLSIYDDTYTDVKRLQRDIEQYMAGLRRVWLSGDGDECPVWVHLIKAFTMPDGYQVATKRRVAVSEFEIKYAEA